MGYIMRAMFNERDVNHFIYVDIVDGVRFFKVDHYFYKGVLSIVECDALGAPLFGSSGVSIRCGDAAPDEIAAICSDVAKGMRPGCDA